MTYSIIIPHHNTPQLLERCLGSIPDCEDIQVIVVDDNSNSQIVDFSKFPSLNRSNTITLFTKEGKGAGYARNIALQQAKGEWLLFADADDYFLPNAFDLIRKYKDSEADIVYFHSKSCFSDTGLPADRNIQHEQLFAQYDKNNTHSVKYLKYNYLEPWGKLIKRQLVVEHSIRFDEVMHANDVMFSTKTAFYADKIEVSDDPIYCITVASGSLVHIRSLESRRQRYEVMLRTNLFLRENGEKQYEHSIMYSLRIAASYGIKPLWEFIQLGKKYNARFFVGASHWFKNALFHLFHNEDKDKKKYLKNE